MEAPALVGDVPRLASGLSFHAASAEGNLVQNLSYSNARIIIGWLRARHVVVTSEPSITPAKWQRSLADSGIAGACGLFRERVGNSIPRGDHKLFTDA
jgi:hypothetical protein